MQRYTVTVVSSGTSNEKPVLLVPFQSAATVTVFVDELFKRIDRQGLAIAPNTHVATLHLDSETGGLIDYEDALSDVVLNPQSDKIFAVFSKKDVTSSTGTTDTQKPSLGSTNGVLDDSASLSIRIVTSNNAKTLDSCPVLRLPVSATIRQLHDSIADELKLPREYDEDADANECNCELANKLADGPGEDKSFLVVHGKARVERLHFENATEASLKSVLRQRLGFDFENTKKVNITGGELLLNLASVYKKNPVAAVCSKNRHTPAHARVEVNDANQRRSVVLDLHTFELPIHPACMEATLEQAGLCGLVVDGIVDVYCVKRQHTGSHAVAIGKSNIFRARAHWEPSVVQSDRGMAMFLSSLRVFASLVQDMQDDDRSQDAVLHAFDLLTQFPPALRTLYILTQGKTPTAAESAALAQALYESMDSFMSNFTEIIGTDHSRVFEGARLFFGFVLEKARTLKLSADEGAKFPYLSSFSACEIRGHLTGEAVMRAVNTSKGLIEASLFESFQDGGLLATSYLQAYLGRIPIDDGISRVALLSAGTVQEITVFSKPSLASDYRYADGGDISAGVDVRELSELDHLAELCGRNKLAVHRPRQLASAVAPCLTFDRNAHLAVYTGEQPCGDPGRSSMLFRPESGEETIDTAVIEQLIVTLIAAYEAEGTAVFDALGGATVRRMQAPDEILMFCVDTSASMRCRTDFTEVNDAADVDEVDDIVSKAQKLVENELYGQVTFDDIKERLCEYEGFQDMVATIGSVATVTRRHVTSQVLTILRTILSCSMVKKAKVIHDRRQHGPGYYHVRHELAEKQAELKTIKLFWAGLKTHEEATIDFLIYRGTSAAHEISQKWTWAIGDNPPSASARHYIPSLAGHIIDLPHHLRCPISHNLMLDAVTAADGFTYSQVAIAQWFTIRSSSPMTGLALQDISLRSNEVICDSARQWMYGDGIPGRDDTDEQPSKRFRPKKSKGLKVTFDSRDGSFSRKVSPNASLEDLYKLAFRGLKGRFIVFQLATDRYGPLSPSPEASISSRNIRNGDHVTIRIAEDDPSSGTAFTSASASNERVLVKVYLNHDSLLFGYWVPRDSTQTTASIIWKFWRHRLLSNPYIRVSERHIWTDLTHSGDNLLTGQPFDTNEKMSKFLNRNHCFGHLGDEKVYQEETSREPCTSGPLVFKVQVDTPHQRREERAYLSRLDVLKQMFEALINRTLAYNYKTHVGLITFATTPNMTMGISHVLENFRRSIGNMSAIGDTALWDALALGKDQLVEYGKKFPQAKKRIICISDGNDTKSTTNTPSDICWRLREAGITVDTVSLGNENNEELTALSYLLGSYRFHPTTLTNALAICELEPFLSLSDRVTPTPPANYPSARHAFMGQFWRACRMAEFTVVTEHTFPKRKPHPNINDSFIQLTAMATHPKSTSTGAGSSRSNLRTSRLMNEIHAISSKGAHPKYDVYVSESDMSFWKVVMSGPDGSPYSEGSFLLYLHADEGYPTFAPKARFVTRIKHPNVNTHGRVCHSIFDRDWTTDITMTTLLDSIYGLLLQPEHSDPVNTTTTLGFHHDQVEFADECRDHVTRYAKKDRAWWKAEILGERTNGESTGDENECMFTDHEEEHDEEEDGLRELDEEGGTDFGND